MIPLGDDAPLERHPVITYALIATNGVVLAVAAARAGYAQAVPAFGFAPAAAELWRFFVALFLPAGVLALLWNGLFLLGMGRTVEDTIGRAAYLLYYAVGGALGLVVYFLVHPDATIPVMAVGAATGAILAAYLLLYPRANIRFYYWAWYWDGNFYLPAWTLIVVWGVIQLLWGYRAFAATGVYPMGHAAALTGLGAGALLALPLRVIAGRVAEDYELADREAASLPPVVQQQAQAKWRSEQSESGEIRPDTGERWAGDIAERLRSGRQSQAIRLFERHSSAHSLGNLEPRTQYELADACLARGRYWRAATLLENIVAASAPPKLQTKSHALLAALYGEHPYFHASATPHLDAALATLPRNSPVRALLHEVGKKVDAARARDLEVDERDRFCLVRETAESYRIAEAGPIIAKATGKDLKEVMRELRNNPGIVAWKLRRQKAFDVAAALGHAGIHVGLIPLSTLSAYGKTEPVEHVSVKQQGVQLQTVGGQLRVPWDNMALVCGGFLVLSSAQQQKVYEEAHNAAMQSGDAFESFDSMARELRHITLIDFWLKEPRRHLRVREHPVRMPEAQLEAVASAILRAAPTVPKNDGLKAVASGVAPPDCLFDSRDYFTYHGVWQLHLRNWDDLPRVSDSLIHNLSAELRNSM